MSIKTESPSSSPVPPSDDDSAIEVGTLQYNHAVIWVCVFIIEALVIIVVNTLAIMVFTSKKYRSKKSNILMVNLAVADLLVGFLATVFQIYVIGEPLWQYHFDFYINVMFDMFTGLASLFSLTAIALERMHATLFPVHYKFLRASKYGIVIAVIWLLSSSVAGVAFLVPPDILPISPTYIIASLLSLSVALIIFSYTSIGIKLTKQKDFHKNNRNQRQVNFIKTLFLVTFLSLISWLPFQVIILVKYMSNNRYGIDNAHVVITTKFLQYGNSFVNTIVYYFRIPGFRSDLESILTQKCQCALVCLRACQHPRDNTQDEEPGDENGDSRYVQSAVTQTIMIEDTKL